MSELETPLTNLRVVREHTLRDVPANLRALADDIEAGKLGEVLGCVTVVDAFKLQVYYWGEGEAAPNAHLLLHSGAAVMVKAVLEAKT